jgi:hypothetical protein
MASPAHNPEVSMLLLLLACNAASKSPDTSDTADTADTADTSSCPKAALFPELTANAANAAYPDPEVTAKCDGTDLVVTSNGIPWYEFVALTPNELAAQSLEARIPLEPVAAAEPITLNLLGGVGFALVGLPVNSPNEAAVPEPYGDPVYNEIVDACYGHTGPNGDYHLHAMDVLCSTMVAPVSGAPSPIIGFALDGFPIYGPDACLDADCTEIATMQSGYAQTGDPTTYAWDAYSYTASSDPTVLDVCNGRTEPDGSYGYHMTRTFPYVVGCYHGEVTLPEGGGGGGDTGMPPVEDCADVEAGMPCCGDGVCDGPETNDNCPADCPA